MRECMKELVHLLQAKMQCIWITTYEEAEVIRDLKEIANTMTGIKLKTWSHTEGLTNIALTKVEKQEEPNRKVNLDGIFQAIATAQDDQGTKNSNIFILKDLHLINDGHQVKRLLRDVKERHSINYNPIIVISPVTSIPIEHEKLFHVLHYNTPDRKAIQNVVSKMTANMQKSNKEKQAGYIVPAEDEARKIVSALVGLTHNEIMNTLALSLTKYKALSLEAIMEQKIQLVEKSGVLDYKIPQARLEDVGGNEAFKTWIGEVESSMSEEAAAFGCDLPKGYLALGIPGTAKTYLAEAIANKWGVPLLSLNMSKIMNKLVGESEKKIDQAFRIAKACAPCVMLFDEVEKALAGTKSSNASDAGTTSRVFSTVLQFLQENNGVFVVMTSNDVTQLPPELTRSGRLDAMWYFSLPTEEERKSIFRIHLAKTGKEISEDLVTAAANATENYTGAEIKDVVKQSMWKAYRRYLEDGQNMLIAEDVVSAARSIVPIYQSSQERITFLEEWVKGRARFTNGQIDENGYDMRQDNSLLDDVLNSVRS